MPERAYTLMRSMIRHYDYIVSFFVPRTARHYCFAERLAIARSLRTARHYCFAERLATAQGRGRPVAPLPPFPLELPLYPFTPLALPAPCHCAVGPSLRRCHSAPVAGHDRSIDCIRGGRGEYGGLSHPLRRTGENATFSPSVGALLRGGRCSPQGGSGVVLGGSLIPALRQVALSNQHMLKCATTHFIIALI